MEGAAGIPGTVGGAIAGNAGAKDWEVAGLLLWADLMDAGGNVTRGSREDLKFRYRRLELAPGEVVLAGGFGFDRAGSPEDLIARMNEIMERRRQTQPLGERSAGSVFKNPPGDFAGRLIEAAGLKGERLGGAQVSTKHANFIVNTGGATAADVLGLIELIQAKVKERFGVELELEIKVIG
jgi:UDP-N-acetylmuramate dehydrogenase